MWRASARGSRSKTFDELARLPEPIEIGGATEVLLKMGPWPSAPWWSLSPCILYYRLQRHRPISTGADDVVHFVSLRKAVCLGLLLDFFVVFFTVLVFSDVLLVLASLTVTREYPVVFRNFTFAVVTVFLRIALVADPYPKALLGAATALFALAAAWAFDFSRPASTA